MNIAVADDAFYSPRELSYIKPAGRRLSDYEAVTCFTQPDLGHFDSVGWFLLGEEGEPLFDPASTAVRHPDWFQFRDPSAMWNRPYVAHTRDIEQSLQATLSAAVAGGALADMDRAWAREILGCYYDGFAYAEWGLFMALVRGVRPALSDSLTTALVLASVDRLRHQQDIALFSLELEDHVVGYESLGRAHWFDDPILAPTRVLVEGLMATVDWVEVMFVVGAIVDPLLSCFFLGRFLRRYGSRNGDIVTPAIIVTVEQDHDRTTAATAALIRMLTTPPPDGADFSHHNRAVLQHWLDVWVPRVRRSFDALAPLFRFEPVMAGAAECARRYVEQRWASWVAELGLLAPSVWP